MTDVALSHRPSASPERLARLVADYALAVREKRLRTVQGVLVLFAVVGLAGLASEIDFGRFSANIWRFPNYLANLLPSLTWANLGSDVAEWFWGWKRWLRLLAETLLIAYLGTVLGVIGAFVLCFHAAANVAPSRIGRFVVRRYFEFCRTVPEIVFALIFVIAFGLGPVPGVLAIAIHTFGALGKLFTEVVENADMRTVDGVSAAGAGWTETMRFAVVPQVMSSFASYALLRFEINVRGAAIMGFVGAGGIGQELITAVRKFYYGDIGAILILIIGTVMIIDLSTDRLQHGLLGSEARP